MPRRRARGNTVSPGQREQDAEAAAGKLLQGEEGNSLRATDRRRDETGPAWSTPRTVAFGGSAGVALRREAGRLRPRLGFDEREREQPTGPPAAQWPMIIVAHGDVVLLTAE